MLLTLLLLHRIGWSWSCWGGGAKEDDTENKTSSLDPNNPVHWNGWEPVPGVVDAWTQFIVDYRDQAAGKGGAKDPNSPGEPYGYDIPDWPAHWTGLGPPLTGARPPPWAYVPKNLGKPSFCYLPPVRGNCSRTLVRYGFNPFKDECQPFLYSGCGGNWNNFRRNESCWNACVNMPISGCSEDPNKPVDDYQ